MIVANRELKLYQGRNDIGVRVRIFAPEQDGGAWSTKYEIDWPDGTRTGAAKGFDSVQSLLIAFNMIGAEIYASDYHKSGKLRWTSPETDMDFQSPAI